MLEKSSLRKRCVILVLLIFGLLLGAAWAQSETVLYSFCAHNNCADGSRPYAGVVLDQKGNLYGTTYFGGADNGKCGSAGCGVVFQLTPQGKETVLYSFCVQINCTDGQYPDAGVVLDQKGILHGTTAFGGAHNSNACGIGYGYGCGVVFKLTPKGKETVLYSFCAQNSTCTDGATPEAGLTFDRNGNLYGTTLGGGTHGYGVVFKAHAMNPASAENGPRCRPGVLPDSWRKIPITLKTPSKRVMASLEKSRNSLQKTA